MKALHKSGDIKTINFDFKAPIQPNIGMGGIFFNQTIKDFQEALVNKSLDNSSFVNFKYSIDEKFFSLTITSIKDELEIEIDLLNGRINSMICYKGYLGLLNNEFGIGSSIKKVIKKDNNLGYNLDTNWFSRTPFDGLIIYPPFELEEKCFSAAIDGTEFPDFKIKSIELIDLEFAKKLFSDGQLTF